MATTTVTTTTMKVAQVSKAGADFEIIERKIPDPGAGQVRIKVQACPRGRRDSVSALVGMAATTARVASAGEEIFVTAGIEKFPASAMTADTRNTWLPLS